MNTTDAIPDRDYANARARLRAHRLASGLSFKAFAERCGIRSPSLIHEYESGKRTPTFANALGIEKGTSGVAEMAAVAVELWGFDRATARRAAA